MKKKIAFIGNYYPKYRTHLFNGLSQKFNIDVFHDINYKIYLKLIEENNNFRVFHSKVWFKKYRLNFQPKALKNILLDNYFAVILPLRISDINTWISLLLFRLFKTKVVLWGHIKRWSKAKRIFYKIIMYLANSIIVYNDIQKMDAIKLGINARKIFVGYNSLDTEELVCIYKNLSDKELTEFKEENQLINKKILLFTGRLDTRKRIDLLLSAISFIKNDVPEIFGIIIGDGPEKQKLIKLANKLNIANNVLFVNAIYDENELVKYFKSSEIYVIPGLAGLSILHAFAYSIPIIISTSKNNGPESELVTNYKTGILFQESNLKELVLAIKFYLDNEQQKSKIVATALELVKEKYNSKTMCLGFINAIYY